MFADYSKKYPELASELNRRFKGELPADWKKCLTTYTEKDTGKATRNYGETAINQLAVKLPELIGGSADLNPSTLTYLKNSVDFTKEHHGGKNLRFGVREHAMAAISNGIAAYGGFIPFCSTFFNFIGYAMGAVRLSAISSFGVIYVMTHDSIGLGEDGPTHQPINSMMMIRSMPHILAIRPSDGNETAGAWAIAIENRHRPTVIVLSRQTCPNLHGTSLENVAKGAYVISDSQKTPQIILLGTGSETSLCVEAAKQLTTSGVSVRVVSMPCWKLFNEQSLEYRKSVLIPKVPVLAVEALSTTGWAEFSHAVIGMTTFGESGPGPKVFEKFGFTPKNIVDKATIMLKYYETHDAHDLLDRPF